MDRSHAVDAPLDLLSMRDFPRRSEGIAAVFELSPSFVTEAWRASASAPGLRFRVYRTAVRLFHRRHTRGAERDRDELLIVDHLDALADCLVEYGLLSRVRWRHALVQEALTRIAMRLGKDPGELATLADVPRFEVRARELVLGMVPTAEHLALVQRTPHARRRLREIRENGERP